MAERGPTATLLHPLFHLSHMRCSTCYMCVARHVIRVWIGSGARDLGSTVAHGFVKHGFKVLIHHIVDGALQASRCLVTLPGFIKFKRTPFVYTLYTRVFWA